MLSLQTVTNLGCPEGVLLAVQVGFEPFRVPSEPVADGPVGKRSGNGWPSWDGHGMTTACWFQHVSTLFSAISRLMSVDVQWDFPLRRDCLYKFM